MFVGLDLICGKGSRRSILLSWLIGKLDTRCRFDLVIKLGQWYQSKLAESTWSYESHSPEIFQILANAYLVHGKLEKKLELENLLLENNSGYCEHLKEQLILQNIILTKFCLGDWKGSYKPMKKIHNNLLHIYKNPELLIGDLEDDQDKEMLSEDIREVASCFIQETLYTVSIIYSAFGRYDQAKECLLKSIKYAEELNGKRHIGTTIFYQELGDACLKMGDLETATEMTELAMLLRKKYMPSNTLSLSNSHMSMGNIYLAKGELEEAQSMFDKVEKVYKAHGKYGGLINMPFLLESKARLAFARQDHEKCLELVSESINLYDQFFVEKHVYSLGALALKIACLKKIGRDNEAMESISIHREILSRFQMDDKRGESFLPQAA